MTTQLTHTVTLPDLGVEAVLRPARLADAYLAAELVKVPDSAANPDGMNTQQRVAYQIQLDDMAILAQIAELEGDRGPKSLTAVRDMLSPDDMAVLRDGAEALKKKKRAANRLSATCAPSSAPSSSAAGAPTTSAAPT
jgi:hypothetical protein